MLVTQKNFEEFVSEIVSHKKIGYDTETKGLWHWKSFHNPVVPGVFAAQFAVSGQAWYLDFHHSKDKLGDAHWKVLQAQLFSNPEILWYIHNAKFDMHQSANHGVRIAGVVHCTQAIARVMNNIEDLNEATQGKIKGAFKLDTLCEKYLGEKKLELENIPTTKIKKFGDNDKFEELRHYDRLPLEQLVPYGLRDTQLAYKLGEFQVGKIAKIDAEMKATYPTLKTKTLTELMEQERKLTKVLFEMERPGVLIDLAYTTKAYYHEIESYKKCIQEFDDLCRSQLGKTLDIQAPRQLKELFEKLGLEYSYTEKGNVSFDSDALQRSNSEVAKIVLKYRYHHKRAHTYFENYIWLADTDGYMHCNLQQGGADTGRMSCWDPNLQNVPKRSDKQEKEYPVRKCFIPRPGGFFADMDLKAAEYRLMFDYAGQMDVIADIKNGLDPHDATLKLMSKLKDRDAAKTMNFRVLYGSGKENIGWALGAKTKGEAETLGNEARNAYYSGLNKVKKFIFDVRDTASSRGFVVNWAGRILRYGRNSSYKSPNGIIQGGVGDISKKSLVDCAELLRGKESRLLLQVHDANLFWIKFGEENLLSELQAAMRNVYVPRNGLPQDVDAKYSAKSWLELVDTVPAA